MGASKLAVQALKRLPKNMISRAFGTISDVEFPRPVQKLVNHSFAAFSGIDTSEAERPPGGYESLNAYFTRRLKEGVRTVEAADEASVVSPVDGRVGAFGAIDEGTLFQAKGREYRLLDLVDSAEEADRYWGGWYATIYLSPRDYHRIHCPVQGRVEKISYIPGHLFPVNAFAVENIDELFAVNERLITYLQTPQNGHVGVVKVGATCVGRIALTYDPMVTNSRFRQRQEFSPNSDAEFTHGDELAVFNLGSTVILLIEDEGFRFRKDLGTGQMLKMGEKLGSS